MAGRIPTQEDNIRRVRSEMLYCQAVFPRGAGLGTRLFPWARCAIFAQANKIPMLAPQWVQPRVGPLLRGGIDIGAYHRQILLLGLFRHPPGTIRRLGKLFVQLTGTRVEEPVRLDETHDFAPSDQKVIVTFHGVGDKFERLNGHDQFLLESLQAITRHGWIEFVDGMGSVPIGINVRLGNDFGTARSDEEYYTKGPLKTPVEWFVACLEWLRGMLGYPARAVVVSDGTRAELGPLLDLENVEFIRPGCAISDLLILAKSQLLLASGGSSFSAWASFLGQMPTISHPGQSLSWFRLTNRHGYYVGEFDPISPPSQFAEQVRTILRATS